MSVDNAAHLALSELEPDIMASLREDETSKLPSLRLLRSQPHVSLEMRPQLIEFMAQTQAALELLPETLALAVSILDRYMSKRIVYAHHYQLVGCVSLWLAAKAIDDKHQVPTVGTLAYLCADTYAESMFKEMELHVLSTLEWAILAPTAFDYIDLDMGPVACQLGALGFSMSEYHAVRSMARYVCECGLFSQNVSAMRPSIVAATAVALATTVIDVLESRGWPPAYPEGCSKECFDALVVVMSSPPSECAARYSGPDQCAASPIFAKFFTGLGTEASNEGQSFTHEFYISGQNIFYFGTQNDEPCTPIRARPGIQRMATSNSPYDEDLISPANNTESPNTYFVPLTPNEHYVAQSRPENKQNRSSMPFYFSSNQDI